jgi:hypothetical protein
MIRIDRSGTACPEELRTKGEEELARLRVLAAASELKSTHFKKTIYGSLAVKSAVWTMQSGKAATASGSMNGSIQMWSISGPRRWRRSARRPSP